MSFCCCFLLVRRRHAIFRRGGKQSRQALGLRTDFKRDDSSELGLVTAAKEQQNFDALVLNSKEVKHSHIILLRKNKFLPPLKCLHFLYLCLPRSPERRTRRRWVSESYGPLHLARKM